MNQEQAERLADIRLKKEALNRAFLDADDIDHTSGIYYRAFNILKEIENDLLNQLSSH